MKKKSGKKPHFPRKTWVRSPVQKPHSDPGGKKGYDRKREEEELRRELGEKPGAGGA